ncbi:FUSC family protein [Halomonas salifodinae]|uniref:FUSC family protein n=1 Tax=Halomonas salifodinae TaxID=438745 RepID=UPI0033BD3F3F
MSTWRRAYLPPPASALRFATKATLAMLLALYAALWLDLERPYWALISAAFLQLRPLSGMVIEKGLSQLAGTLAGCLAGIAIMAAFVQVPPAALGALTLWIMLCTYVSSLQSSNAAYGCIMASVTAMLIVVIAATAPQALFSVAVERLTELSLGALCATLVSALLWPVRVRDHLIDQADTVLTQAFTHAAQRLGDADPATLQASLTAGLMPLTELEPDSRAARYEDPDGSGRIRASRLLTHRTLRLMATLHALQQLRRDDRLPDEAACHTLLGEAAEQFAALAEGPLSGEAGRARLQALRHRVLSALEALEATETEETEVSLPPPGDLAQQRLLIGLREALGHALVMLDARAAIATPGGQRLHGCAPARHRDRLSALLNALRAGGAFALLAGFWLATGWEGAMGAMMIATLLSALFAGFERPVGASVLYLQGLLAAIPSALLFGHVLLAPANGFPLLALLLLTPLFLGLLGAAEPRLMGPCLAFVIGNIILIMPGNAMSFAVDDFVNRALGMIIGVTTVVMGFRLLPGLPTARRRRRLIRATVHDLRRLYRRPLHQAEARFSGAMADRLLDLARHDEDLPEAQRHLFALGLTGLDLGYAGLLLRRRLDGLADPAVDAAKRRLFAALATAYAASAAGHRDSRLAAASRALLDALADHPRVSPRERHLLAGLLRRLDLALAETASRHPAADPAPRLGVVSERPESG